MSTIVDLRNARLEKLERLRKLGVNPYPSKSFKNIENSRILEDFGTLEGQEVVSAGRIMSFRRHGKLVFIDVQDFTGKIQFLLREDTYSGQDHSQEELTFEDLDLLDTGDFVEGLGKVTKSNSGEISVAVEKLRLLSKSLRPAPLNWEGLQDKETRLRKRYLDLLVNPQIKERFIRKSRFWEVSREFLRKRGFLEIETPVLELVTGGADATPFVTHHNALDQDFFLRISSELYQKRLIGGGFEKIFVLGPNFRNEGMDDEHLQEYYQLEWYWAYASYRDNMALVKEMLKYISHEVYGKTKFEKNGLSFDLSSEWQELDYTTILQKELGVDIFADSEEKMIQLLRDKKAYVPQSPNRHRLVDNLWKIIRREIAGPAFLVNIPKFMSPLAKSQESDPRLTERFQVILAGSELGNGYSELNDPLDQLDRFREQQRARDMGDSEAQMLDVDFIEMLEYGMPPTSGYGHSERLFWFLEGISSREGTLFPQVKSELDETTKNIYNLQ